jgi:Fe-S cluster biogenesis protein NfuA
MSDSKREFTRRSDRIEELVGRIESASDPALRAVAKELLEAVLELHGVALDRILDAVADLPAGERTLMQIAEDPLVSSVLSLHGIHPVAMETRIVAAIEKTRPYLTSHGGDVELAAVQEDGTVHVRLQGSCGSCGSSAETLKNKVETAIYDAAPEVTTVIAEAVGSSPNDGLVILQTN